VEEIRIQSNHITQRMMLSIFLILSLNLVYGEVVQLDSSNFDSIAMDPAKNVLVDFYSQNCGHCTAMASAFDNVARDFESEPNCIVAKIDAKAYKDIGDRFGVYGYPTIKLFSIGNKGGEDYTGGRGEQDFLNFLNEKCSTNRIAGGATLS